MANSQQTPTRFDIRIVQGDDEIVELAMPAGFVLAGWTPRFQCRDNQLSDPLLCEAVNWAATEHATRPYWRGHIAKAQTSALVATDGDDLVDAQPRYTYHAAIERSADGFARTLFVGTVSVMRNIAS